MPPARSHAGVFTPVDPLGHRGPGAAALPRWLRRHPRHTPAGAPRLHHPDVGLGKQRSHPVGLKVGWAAQRLSSTCVHADGACGIEGSEGAASRDLRGRHRGI
eukprot:162452-Chlamydomonas_euryale.AAC.6